MTSAPIGNGNTPAGASIEIEETTPQPEATPANVATPGNQAGIRATSTAKLPPPTTQFSQPRKELQDNPYTFLKNLTKDLDQPVEVSRTITKNDSGEFEAGTFTSSVDGKEYFCFEVEFIIKEKGVEKPQDPPLKMVVYTSVEVPKGASDKVTQDNMHRSLLAVKTYCSSLKAALDPQHKDYSKFYNLFENLQGGNIALSLEEKGTTVTQIFNPQGDKSTGIKNASSFNSVYIRDDVTGGWRKTDLPQGSAPGLLTKGQKTSLQPISFHKDLQRQVVQSKKEEFHEVVNQDPAKTSLDPAKASDFSAYLEEELEQKENEVKECIVQLNRIAPYTEKSSTMTMLRGPKSEFFQRLKNKEFDPDELKAFQQHYGRINQLKDEIGNLKSHLTSVKEQNQNLADDIDKSLERCEETEGLIQVQLGKIEKLQKAYKIESSKLESTKKFTNIVEVFQKQIGAVTVEDPPSDPSELQNFLNSVTVNIHHLTATKSRIEKEIATYRQFQNTNPPNLNLVSTRITDLDKQAKECEKKIRELEDKKGIAERKINPPPPPSTPPPNQSTARPPPPSTPPPTP